MSTNQSTETTGLGKMTRLLGDLLKILGGLVGASSFGATIIYAIGFVVVNTSLLRHGAYELSLLRTEFLAAGISYSVVTLVTILIGAVGVKRCIEVVEPLLSRARAKQFGGRLKVSDRTISLVVIFLSGFVLLLIVSLVAGRFSAVVQWRDRFGRGLGWVYMVALVGGIYVGHLEGKDFWQQLTGTAPATPEIGKAILGGIGLLLLALVTYGGIVYPHLPKSFGGGSPLYVEFVVKEEAIPMLEVLGLEVGDGGLTERVQFLTECPERMFVISQRGDTLAFDPALVKASRFYDVNYYVSAELHLGRGDWYRGERQWSNAIREYKAALLIQADLLDAWIGRGRAHTEKYLESAQRGSPDQQAYNSADGDLTEAIRRAEEMGDDHTRARALYQRGRLRFHHGEHQDEAPTDVGDAIEADASLLRVAMLEEAFKESILNKEDDAFRRAMHESEVWLADEYARLGRELKEGGEETRGVAPYAYDLAASIAEDIVNDDKLAAQHRAHGGDALETISLEDAVNQYREAVRLDPDVTHYSYRLALLSYKHGLLEEANQVCDEVIGDAKEDVATIGCLIVRGNVRRDSEEWEDADAIADYARAVSQAVEFGVPSLAASAYYDWARLEARRENTELAILLLERAVWLDRAHGERAQLESDFDTLRELADYQGAISPPIVVEVQSDTGEGTVGFFLQAPADEFPERLSILTQILRMAELYKPDGTGEAESFDISEDGLLYTFHLREEPEYTAGEVASALRNLLGLEE